MTGWGSGNEPIPVTANESREAYIDVEFYGMPGFPAMTWTAEDGDQPVVAVVVIHPVSLN